MPTPTAATLAWRGTSGGGFGCLTHLAARSKGGKKHQPLSSKASRRQQPGTWPQAESREAAQLCREGGETRDPRGIPPGCAHSLTLPCAWLSCCRPPGWRAYAPSAMAADLFLLPGWPDGLLHSLLLRARSLQPGLRGLNQSEQQLRNNATSVSPLPAAQPGQACACSTGTSAALPARTRAQACLGEANK